MRTITLIDVEPFNNGNKVSGEFTDKASAIEFLHVYQPEV